MDWLILGFLACGFLFFWGVWIFAYMLPMARESQRQFDAEQVRESPSHGDDIKNKPVEPRA